METVQESKKLSTNYSKSVKSVSRRKRVISSLELQLKLGTKTPKAHLITKATVGVELEQLTEHDIKRINSELLTLKSRV